MSDTKSKYDRDFDFEMWNMIWLDITISESMADEFSGHVRAAIEKTSGKVKTTVQHWMRQRLAAARPSDICEGDILTFVIGGDELSGCALSAITLPNLLQALNELSPTIIARTLSSTDTGRRVIVVVCCEDPARARDYADRYYKEPEQATR